MQQSKTCQMVLSEDLLRKNIKDWRKMCQNVHR